MWDSARAGRVLASVGDHQAVVYWLNRLGDQLLAGTSLDRRRFDFRVDGKAADNGAVTIAAKNGSKTMSGLARTVILGTLVAAAGIWWLGRAYEVEGSQLAGYLLSSVLLIAAVIVLAATVALIIRRLRRRPLMGLTPRKEPRHPPDEQDATGDP